MSASNFESMADEMTRIYEPLWVEQTCRELAFGDLLFGTDSTALIEHLRSLPVSEAAAICIDAARAEDDL